MLPIYRYWAKRFRSFILNGLQILMIESYVITKKSNLVGCFFYVYTSSIQKTLVWKRDWLRPSQQSSALKTGLTSSIPQSSALIILKIKKRSSELGVFSFLRIHSWPRWDSNPHALTSTTPSRWQVYQFLHVAKKKPSTKENDFVVTWLGLEPRTPSLKVMCSTNWAIESKCISPMRVQI